MDNVYWLDDKYIYLKFKYNHVLIAYLKKIPNAYFNYETKAWVVSIYFISESFFKVLESHGLTKLKEVKNKVSNDFKKDDKAVDKFLSSLTPFADFIHEIKLKIQPRSYQKPAINLILNKEKVLIADDMGLGKTLETIFAIELGDLFPTLIVCPSSVKYNWKKSWLAANPDRSIHVIESNKPLPESDVYVINYDILSESEKAGEKKIVNVKNQDLLKIDLMSIVFDEAHYLKNSKSGRAIIAERLAKGVQFRIALTGTPIESRPQELINILKILGQFKPVFNDWESFVLRYCDAKKTNFGWDTKGSSNLIELNQKLRTSCYIRRLKTEVMKDLPSTQSVILPIELTNRSEYDRASDNFISFLQKSDKDLTNFDFRSEFIVKRSKLKQLAIKGKFNEIKNWIENFLLNSDEKLIIAGISVEPLETLQKKFNGLIVNGSTTAKKKQEYVDKFQSDKSIRLLFGNMQSMGTGTDGLQHVCSNILIIELPEKPSTLEQLKARTDRSEQKHSSTYTFALAQDSIDEDLWAFNEEKRVVAAALNEGEMIETLDFDELLYKKLKNK